MKFFNTIQNSIYSPAFYQSIPKKSFGQSIKYFLLLILSLTVISLIFIFQDLVFGTPLFIKNLAQDTLNCFPKDLQIKITKGEASANVEEPYFLENCAPSLREVIQTNTFGVIDTKNPFSQAKFDEYNTQVWLTKDAVITKDGNYRTRLYSLKEVDNFNLNKEIINSVYNQFSPYLKFVGPALLVLAFLGIFIFNLFRLLQLLLTASLIYLLGKIFRNPLNFSSSYKIGLFAATLGLIVDLVVNTTSKYTGFYGFPFMFTVITLGVVVVNLFLPAKKASS